MGNADKSEDDKSVLIGVDSGTWQVDTVTGQKHEKRKDNTAGKLCSQADEELIAYVTTEFADDIGKFDETTLFSCMWYKVDVVRSEMEGIFHMFTAVLNTAASLNLIG